MAHYGLAGREAMEALKRIKEQKLAEKAAQAFAEPARLTTMPVTLPASPPVLPKSNTLLIVGGLAAAAAVAFFVLKRKKKG